MDLKSKLQEMRKNTIHLRKHTCTDPIEGVICFEHENELWIKEFNVKEGKELRTYKVNFCPICGGVADSDVEPITHLEKDYEDNYIPLEISRGIAKLLRESAKMCESVSPYTEMKSGKPVIMRTSPAMMVALALEEILGWKYWMEAIPGINFPSEWKVRIIPPFAGAVARFKIDYNDFEVSVYLDCYDVLGYYGSPYWEIYPHHGDTLRISMEDVSGLIKGISEALSDESKEKYDNSVSKIFKEENPDV